MNISMLAVLSGFHWCLNAWPICTHWESGTTDADMYRVNRRKTTFQTLYFTLRWHDPIGPRAYRH